MSVAEPARVARLIVTDLDGTLIDHHTYAADAARPALAAAAAAGVPIVACSSKTRAEMRVLARALDLAAAPFIAENGSLIWFPGDWPRRPATAHASPDGDGYVVVLGTAASALLPVLAQVAAAVGRQLRPLSLMPLDEVIARTGLAPEVARLASARECSQPFVLEGPPVPLDVLAAAARPHRARVTQGGRFFHLLGDTDKGRAVRVVRDTWAAGHRALGLGDAPNDLPLLRATDDAVIVPQPDRGWHPDLIAALPAARRAPLAGPAGWNAAVLEWLDGP